MKIPQGMVKFFLDPMLCFRDLFVFFYFLFQLKETSVSTVGSRPLQ